MSRSPHQLSAAQSSGPLVAGGADANLIALNVERLALLISEEVALLRQHRLDELPRLTERKGQALLDLMRQSSGLDAVRSTPTLRGALSRLRELLELDRRLLKNHIDAVTETSATIAKALADQDGDGTYTIVAGAGVRFR